MPELRGRCDACGKTFRVPAAGRVYRCKACGGKVRPPESEAEPEPAEPPAARDCPACGAVNPASARFCEECGGSFERPASRRRRGDSVERKEAAVLLRRAKKAVSILRFFYVVAAMSSFAATAVAVKLLRVAPGNDALPYLLIGLLALLTVMYVAGAVEIARQPFFWAVLIASLGTLEVAVRLAFGGTADLEAGDFRHMALVALTWAAVAATIPVARIVREHPDFWMARGFGAGRGRGKRAKPDAEDAGPPPAVDWARLGKWLAGAAAAVALACGLHFSSRLPSIDGPAEAFASAWYAGDVTGVNALVAEEHRDRFGRSLERGLERKGWTPLPRVELGAVLYYEKDKLSAVFGSNEGPLETTWQFLDGRWELRGVDLP